MLNIERPLIPCYSFSVKDESDVEDGLFLALQVSPTSVVIYRCVEEGWITPPSEESDRIMELLNAADESPQYMEMTLDEFRQVSRDMDTADNVLKGIAGGDNDPS